MWEGCFEVLLQRVASEEDSVDDQGLALVPVYTMIAESSH